MIKGPACAVFLLALLVIGTLPGWACGKSAAPNEAFPTPVAPIPQRYTDARLGFSFEHFNDWYMTSSNVEEGPVATVTSPEGAVSVQVVRDLPPPMVDLPGYGKAMVHALRLSLPGLEVREEKEQPLSDGTPAYRASFTVSGDTEQAGELLVLFRSTEAFLVQAAGPQPAYQAWAPGVRMVLDSFHLEPLRP